MRESLFTTCLAVGFACASTGLAHAQSAPPKVEEKGTFSVVVENDLFTHTDRDYTSGVRASWVAAPNDTPQWAINLAKQLPLFAGWGVVRTEYAIQQAIFTPRDTNLSIPDPRDRPYAGALNASLGLIGETGPLLDQLSLSVGVVGPASLARQAQKLVHNILGEDSPHGWNYQLRNEPTIQLRYQRSWRALAAYAFNSDYGIDVTPHAGLALGNMYTFANGGVTFRIGKDLQQDYGPPRVGPSVPGAGFFEPRSKFGWYFFAGVEGRAVARNIFLDGNSFVDSAHVSKRVFVADVQGGLAMTYDRVRLSYTQVWRSKEFYGQESPEKFGAITASVRW